MCRERGRKRERREGEVVPKIDQRGNLKSSKNQLKIDQEETENPQKKQSKICQKSILEGSRGVLGGSWRPRSKNERGARFFETLLGPSWRPLGPSWRRLGTLLAVLAASWARLRLVLAAEIRANIEPKIDQNFDASWDRYFIQFSWNFNSKMEASWYQNSIENPS